MPLRDSTAFDEWIEREAPSDAARWVAGRFLVEAGNESWRYPSIPLDDLSSQPDFEVRQAELPVVGEDRPVFIWYRHFYATDDVDVIAVTNR
jgi:hypothetical protein